jgi:hypothetical protein
MAEAAHAAETTKQLINIGIIIITRSTIFSSNICKWQDKPIANKTSPGFNEHFKAAQKAIKKATGHHHRYPWLPRAASKHRRQPR